MAELHIERKERSTWPWVLLGVALLALLLWFLFGRGDDAATQVGAADSAISGEAAGAVAPAATAPVAADTAADATSGAMPAAVTNFVQFLETSSAPDANLDHDYTADGLRHLAGALEAVTANAQGTPADAAQRIAGIRERADAMQRNETSTEHARQAREASLLAAGLMRELPGATGAAEAQTAAEAIRADGLLLEQSAAVRRFFEQSATVLRGLAAPTG